MGRPPKPTAIKRLEGNPGNRKLNDDEPQFSSADLTAPVGLDETAKAEWNRLAPELRKLGLLTITSERTLFNLCMAWSNIVECEMKVAEEGMWITVGIFNKKGEQIGTREMESPASVKLGFLRTQHKQLLNEFGGNPSSAAKVVAKKPETLSIRDSIRASLKVVAAGK